jgi:hypothetical protein
MNSYTIELHRYGVQDALVKFVDFYNRHCQQKNCVIHVVYGYGNGGGIRKICRE